MPVTIGLTTTQKLILKNGGNMDPHWILLGNQSACNIFKFQPFVKNVRRVKVPLRCYCISGYQDTHEMETTGGFLKKYGLIENHL